MTSLSIYASAVFDINFTISQKYFKHYSVDSPSLQMDNKRLIRNVGIYQTTRRHIL